MYHLIVVAFVLGITGTPAHSPERKSPPVESRIETTKQGTTIAFESNIEGTKRTVLAIDYNFDRKTDAVCFIRGTKLTREVPIGSLCYFHGTEYLKHSKRSSDLKMLKDLTDESIGISSHDWVESFDALIAEEGDEDRIIALQELKEWVSSTFPFFDYTLRYRALTPEIIDEAHRMLTGYFAE